MISLRQTMRLRRSRQKSGAISFRLMWRSVAKNEVEALNVAAGELWALSRKRDVLDEVFLQRLHSRMFGDAWRWAGKYRSSERNIGVAPHMVPVAMRQTIDDAKYRSNRNPGRRMNSPRASATSWSRCIHFRTATAAGRVWLAISSQCN
jgi:fido (protein-threonine AMPylation protein)